MEVDSLPPRRPQTPWRLSPAPGKVASESFPLTARFSPNTLLPTPSDGKSPKCTDSVQVRKTSLYLGLMGRQGQVEEADR